MVLGLNRKEVQNFPLDDCSTREIIEFLCREEPRRKVAVGVHITTLNSLYENDLNRRHFDVADGIYCDGWSMYILGKAAGLENIQRIATTDLYPLVVSQLKRPLKICFLGGDPQLGPLIIANWIEKYPRDSCTFLDGFPSDWHDVFSRIKSDPPEILFLGLGMPLELQMLESCVRAALNAIDSETEDLALLASLAKARTSDLCEKLMNEAIQLHGGIGVTDEFDLGLIVKRARVLQQSLGDGVFHRNRYACLKGF